jgi:hypothetical protein
MNLDRATLEPMACWFESDHVSGRSDITEFKRRARLRQSEWREQQKLPIGSHSRGGKSYVNGSKIEALAEHKHANFLSPRIIEAVEARIAKPESHQTLDEKRLRYDLLSSMPMCFNLFGELYDDPDRAAKAAATVWGTDEADPVEVRFEWSPGRREANYLGDRTAFDVALVVGPDSSPQTVIGIETKYHEHATREAPPNADTRLPRYRQVAEDSGAFVADWEDRILGTQLQQVWRDHLLLLAMLQRPEWKNGRYVLVHPAGNPAFHELGKRYRDVLEDDSTFEVRTIEELLDAGVLHTGDTEKRFRERYLW